jgi:hypothetical protein
MIEFTVKYSVLNCMWGYKDTFVSLPVPGDEYFSTLYKNLRPYGVALSSITFEEDSESLAEERLVIPLLDGRLKLRLAYAGFDFLLTDIGDDEGFSLSDFAQAIFPVLKQMGADVEQGFVQLSYRAFIYLGETDLDGFLRQHLRGYQDNTQLRPFNFTYQVSLRTGPGSPLVRIHVERSIAPKFSTELYVEMFSEYLAPGEITKFAKQVTDDWHQAFASLDLKLSAAGGKDDASK